MDLPAAVAALSAWRAEYAAANGGAAPGPDAVRAAAAGHRDLAAALAIVAAHKRGAAMPQASGRPPAGAVGSPALPLPVWPIPPPGAAAASTNRIASLRALALIEAEAERESEAPAAVPHAASAATPHGSPPPTLPPSASLPVVVAAPPLPALPVPQPLARHPPRLIVAAAAAPPQVDAHGFVSDRAGSGNYITAVYHGKGNAGTRARKALTNRKRKAALRERALRGISRVDAILATADTGAAGGDGDGDGDGGDCDGDEGDLEEGSAAMPRDDIASHTGATGRTASASDDALLFDRDGEVATPLPAAFPPAMPTAPPAQAVLERPRMQPLPPADGLIDLGMDDDDDDDECVRGSAATLRPAAGLHAAEPVPHRPATAAAGPAAQSDAVAMAAWARSWTTNTQLAAAGASAQGGGRQRWYGGSRSVARGGGATGVGFAAGLDPLALALDAVEALQPRGAATSDERLADGAGEEAAGGGAVVGAAVETALVASGTHVGMSHRGRPLCPGHREESALRRVKKAGANKGRYFYACARERGSQCGFFVWKDADARAAMTRFLAEIAGASSHGSETVAGEDAVRARSLHRWMTRGVTVATLRGEIQRRRLQLAGAPLRGRMRVGGRSHVAEREDGEDDSSDGDDGEGDDVRAAVCLDGPQVAEVLRYAALLEPTIRRKATPGGASAGRRGRGVAGGAGAPKGASPAAGHAASGCDVALYRGAGAAQSAAGELRAGTGPLSSDGAASRLLAPHHHLASSSPLPAERAIPPLLDSSEGDSGDAADGTDDDAASTASTVTSSSSGSGSDSSSDSGSRGGDSSDSSSGSSSGGDSSDSSSSGSSDSSSSDSDSGSGEDVAPPAKRARPAAAAAAAGDSASSDDDAGFRRRRVVAAKRAVSRGKARASERAAPAARAERAIAPRVPALSTWKRHQLAALLVWDDVRLFREARAPVAALRSAPASTATAGSHTTASDDSPAAPARHAPARTTVTSLDPLMVLRRVFGHGFFRGETGIVRLPALERLALSATAYEPLPPDCERLTMQEWAVRRVLRGLNTLVVAATGTGKSLIYQLPAYIMAESLMRQRGAGAGVGGGDGPSAGITIVVSPLLSLIQDQMESLPPGVRAVSLAGSDGATPSDTVSALGDLAGGRAHMLFISPERLLSPVFARLAAARAGAAALLPPVACVAVDEAHVVCEWGHNFRPAYLRLPHVIHTVLRPACVLALTATATTRVVADLAEAFRVPAGAGEPAAAADPAPMRGLALSSSGIWRGDWRRSNLGYLAVNTAPAEKQAALVALLLHAAEHPRWIADTVATLHGREATFDDDGEADDDAVPLTATSVAGVKRRRGASDGVTPDSGGAAGDAPAVPPTLIYVASQYEADTLAQALAFVGISAASFHAGLPLTTRQGVYTRFMRGRIAVVVATIAFGMGVDKPDIRMVLHHSPPRRLEELVQQCGRAGRDGAPSLCIALVDPEAEDVMRAAQLTLSSAPPRSAIMGVMQDVAALLRAARQVAGGSTLPPSNRDVAFVVPTARLASAWSLRREHVETMLCHAQAYGDVLVRQQQVALMEVAVMTRGGAAASAPTHPPPTPPLIAAVMAAATFRQAQVRARAASAPPPHWWHASCGRWLLGEGSGRAGYRVSTSDILALPATPATSAGATAPPPHWAPAPLFPSGAALMRAAYQLQASGAMTLKVESDDWGTELSVPANSRLWSDAGVAALCELVADDAARVLMHEVAGLVALHGALHPHALPSWRDALRLGDSAVERDEAAALCRRAAATNAAIEAATAVYLEAPAPPRSAAADARRLLLVEVARLPMTRITRRSLASVIADAGAMARRMVELVSEVSAGGNGAGAIELSTVSAGAAAARRSVTPTAVARAMVGVAWPPSFTRALFIHDVGVGRVWGKYARTHFIDLVRAIEGVVAGEVDAAIGGRDA